ncbi:MAG: ferrichrome ABC transporter permease [Chloroflexota bacterium]
MAYFAVSIFISALLIFQVQPMIARYILPWFGGTPAVWSTVQMFFQVLLTGGYAYAAWLVRPGKRRERLHLVLLGVSVAVILLLGFIWKSPITPGAAWKPQAVDIPVWEIFKLLAVSVGLPYFLLSSNSPLVQAWFHRAFPEKTAYRLYALSNIGSLLGLVTYPVLVEPYLTLAGQGWTWSLGYLAYAGLAAYGAVRSLRAQRDGEPAAIPLKFVTNSPKGDHLNWRDMTLWVSLAAAASILLLATTSHITQEVAVIPFLWVLPLTIYLLSFILAFSGERWYSRRLFLLLFFAATLLVGWALGRADDINIALQIGIYSLALFSACMVCHGELYRLRPHPERLTSFYLLVSVGGALGGTFITFAAPVLFRGYWELPLGFTLAWLLFFLVALRRTEVMQRWLFVASHVILLSGLVFSSVRAFQFIQSDINGSLLLERNFYGVVRVKTLGAEGWPSQRYALVHGVTIHGFQYMDEEKRLLPTAYFGETSGGGLAILNHPKRGSEMRVGVLGLGIGTLAAYGQPGDVYRFYEINPLVIDLAEGQDGYFSYLPDSQAEIEIALGDARLSLEEELASSGSQEYDVLALDVFSSDSIPVHLLDREAFDLYLQHLAPDGILAVHISNRHLDLVPVVWSLGDYFGLSRVVIADPGNYEETSPSLWVLLARLPALLADPEIASRARYMEDYVSHLRLWTDDYSNLIQILK